MLKNCLIAGNKQINQKSTEWLHEAVQWSAQIFLLSTTKNQQKGVPFILYTVNECFVPLVVIQTCFTVKSADSGIQNSADGSRERLTNTPSNNSLADAGKT